MTWRRTAAVLLAIAVVCPGASVRVAAAADPWGWFAAIAGIDTWTVLSGDASVEISGTSLVAELLDGRDRTAVFTLRGTIRAGRVDVVVVSQTGEEETRRMTGLLKRARWMGTPGGRETILLTAPGDPGGITIGLTREVK